MGFIGVQPTSAPLTSSDITDGIVTTAKIADDAVTSAKIPANAVTDSELNLGSNFAFTGTVTGAGNVVKLLSTTVSSVAYYELSSTYLNSTYDEYLLFVDLLPVDDGANFYNYAFYSNSSEDTPVMVTGTEHSIQTYVPDGGAVVTDTDIDIFYRTRYGVGNSAGEGITLEATIQNVNSLTQPYVIYGHHNGGVAGGTRQGGIFYGSAQPAYRARTLRGIRMIFSSGNIASGYIKLYGIVK